MDILCKKCHRLIGQVVFSWTDPPDLISCDVGFSLYPADSICLKCLFKVDADLAAMIKKAVLLRG